MNDGSSVDSDALPLIVSLTTLPSRIGLLRPMLESLFAQKRRPDGILLCLPNRSAAENTTYERPAWLAEFEPTLQVVRCERDDGPGTKVLGPLPYIQKPACLVVVDDDMRYRPEFLDIMYRAQSANRKASFSFYTYVCAPFIVGQGADGFSFFTPNLQGITDFASRVLTHRQLRVVDDLWISAFLKKRGIAVHSLAHLIPGGGTIYERSHNVNQLADEQGDLARREAMSKGSQFLLESGAMGLPTQLVSLVKKRIRPWRNALRRETATAFL
jgi:hypothetical protein